MPKVPTLIRVLAALGLIISMMSAFATAGSAQVANPSTYPNLFTFDTNECYFASVSNGEDFGLGATQTSVTVQNLTNTQGVVYLKVGKAGFEKGQFAVLEPHAAKTFSAGSLGVPAGATASVVAMAYNMASAQAGVFTAADGVAIGCVAKQAAAGNNLPTTTAVDTAVSGYNATSGREVGYQDDLYIPIVQTNCGPGGCWNTKIRVANVGPFNNASVDVAFFPSDDGSGSLSTGFQMHYSLGQGQVATIDLSALVPDGWVGSAHIYSDDSVVAIADRYKVGTNMWITNTASNAVAERDLQLQSGPSNMPYVLYAPDVRLDYNGWNTGISVANTVDVDNTVNIQYFGNSGNAPQAQTQRLGAHGMTYFYNPSSPSEDGCAQPANQVATCDYVGGAIVLSQAPVAVAVDGVKYFGNDNNVGQAFSYNATGNVFQFQAAPLVQKGSPSTGMGATSGITFLNVNPHGTYATTTWFNPSGTNASNAGPSVVWVPAYATGFVYTMTQANLPNGFLGSAYVQSDLPIAATTANVDYQVSGDGTAIWNLYNPCGLYRAVGDCTFVPDAPAPATKNFSVRPANADAWICIYPVATDGQGKPTSRTDHCVPNWHFAKGANAGGQNTLEHYVANTVYLDGETQQNLYLSLALDREGNAATAKLHVNGVVTPFDPASFRLIAWVRAGTGGALSPTTINATCTDWANADPTANPRLQAFDGDNLTGADIALLGNLENTIIEFSYNGAVFCGQLEAGQISLQTPEQLRQTSGAIAVLRTDNAGNASIDLPEGCYDIVVSAEGFVTEYEHRECLAAGETRLNAFDLEYVYPTPPGTPPLGTKTFDVAGSNGGAWVCIYPAEIVPGVDATPPTEDCLPQYLVEQEAGDTTWYYADEWHYFNLIQPPFDEEDPEVPASYSEVVEVVPTPPFSPVTLEFDFDGQTVTPSSVVLSNELTVETRTWDDWEGWIYTFVPWGFDIMYSTEGGNLTCQDLEIVDWYDYLARGEWVWDEESQTVVWQPLPGVEPIDPNYGLSTINFYLDGTVRTPWTRPDDPVPPFGSLDDITPPDGTPTDAVMIMYGQDGVGPTIYCSPIEQGTIHWETITEMQQRLNTPYTPLKLDANGQGSVQLPEGCYYFMVSVAGHESQLNGPECIIGGQVLPNVLDFTQHASLTKFLCTDLDRELAPGDAGYCVDPLEGYEVLIVEDLFSPDTRIDAVELGNGAYYFAEVPMNQRLMLCWMNPDSPEIQGCETIYITEDTVLYNIVSLTPPVLVICAFTMEDGTRVPIESFYVMIEGIDLVQGADGMAIWAPQQFFPPSGIPFTLYPEGFEDVPLRAWALLKQNVDPSRDCGDDAETGDNKVVLVYEAPVYVNVCVYTPDPSTPSPDDYVLVTADVLGEARFPVHFSIMVGGSSQSRWFESDALADGTVSFPVVLGGESQLTVYGYFPPDPSFGPVEMTYVDGGTPTDCANGYDPENPQAGMVNAVKLLANQLTLP